MSELGNRLLYVVSGIGDLGWPTYVRIFDELYGQCRTTANDALPITAMRRRSVEVLRDLAHIDVDWNERRVIAAPGMLCRLPIAGECRLFFCGSRSPAMLSALRRIARGYRNCLTVTVEQSGDQLAPDRIYVTADIEDTARSFASSAGIDLSLTPSAWRLLDFAGDLRAHLDELEWSTSPELSWTRYDFDPWLCRYRPPNGRDTKLRLSRYTDEAGFRHRYYLWNGTKSSQVDPSFGKHAVCSAANVCPLYYDDTAGIASVPRYLGVPPLYSRALVLCSGEPPRRSAVRGDRDEVAYKQVPRDVFNRVVEKLGYTNPFPTESAQC